MLSIINIYLCIIYICFVLASYCEQVSLTQQKSKESFTKSSRVHGEPQITIVDVFDLEDLPVSVS